MIYKMGNDFIKIVFERRDSKMKIFTLCFTGISGSGKTTLANALLKEFDTKKIKVQMIDGDILREQLGNLFGYTKEERYKNNQVVRVLADYLNRNSVNVILTLVAPYEDMRKKMRETFGEAYVEVYVKCSLEECERRDVKGYYRKIKEGKMENLNGSNDIYEIPQNSEIVIDTEQENVDQGVNKIKKYLLENGYGI